MRWPVPSAKRKNLRAFSHVLVPYLVPIAALSIGVVVHTTCTADPRRHRRRGALRRRDPGRFLFAGVPFVAMVVSFVVTSPNRLGRFDVWLGRATPTSGAPPASRSTAATPSPTAAGSGSASGRAARSGPALEPHNDFIFAIIGEEPGRRGGLAVLLPSRTGLRLRLRRLRTEPSSSGSRRRHHDVDHRAGRDQHRGGHQPPPGHRRAATARVLGWVLLITTMLALGILCPSHVPNPVCRGAAGRRLLWRSLAVLPGVARSRRASVVTAAAPRSVPSPVAAPPATSGLCSPWPTASTP